MTEYTMSEIVAAIYDKMEETGLREGILFIDEINLCLGDAGTDDAAVFTEQDFWQPPDSRRLDYCDGRKSAGI